MTDGNDGFNIMSGPAKRVPKPATERELVEIIATDIAARALRRVAATCPSLADERLAEILEERLRVLARDLAGRGE